jgi:RES domain
VAFLPTDLDCPDPECCPVATALPRLRTTTLREGTALYRVYNATWGYDEHNPGHGDARFSPIDDPANGDRLPSMYLAANATAALLETVFHGVFPSGHDPGGRFIYERDLRGKLLAHLRVPAAAALGDLRDPELRRLELTRTQVVSSPAEHYPCTRRLSVAALRQPRRGRQLSGLIWHSRQAELADSEPVEVVVLFGEPRYASGRGSWPLFGPGATSLYDGPGRLLVDEIAETLGATIELDDD